MASSETTKSNEALPEAVSSGLVVKRIQELCSLLKRVIGSNPSNVESVEASEKVLERVHSLKSVVWDALHDLARVSRETTGKSVSGKNIWALSDLLTRIELLTNPENKLLSNSVYGSHDSPHVQLALGIITAVEHECASLRGS